MRLRTTVSSVADAGRMALLPLPPAAPVAALMLIAANSCSNATDARSVRALTDKLPIAGLNAPCPLVAVGPLLLLLKAVLVCGGCGGCNRPLMRSAKDGRDMDREKGRA